ncbi:hypothetical protein H6F93_08565 [Leptolyngbya sp. FACHB-671]|uniref:hypothetical protein n=1 Tax=Leptolyngbya sp. FACHB-671 TaxID=2692812 RepID=UPI0016890FF0|nr:hypothetical protein [Leptolyngbya sp. FACHB-671]MBD1869123.1 hypothetical protein [Cyanobacteria bacterium FACHB-471]MBD2067582.1 hypothetical protein [Leptolyngbya sp. FACHB-671]
MIFITSQLIGSTLVGNRSAPLQKLMCHETRLNRYQLKSVSGRSDRTFERAKQSAISAVKSVAKMALSNSRY